MGDEATTPPLPQVAGPRTSAAAIFSLIFGVFSFVGCILFAPIAGVICGHVAHWKIRKSGGALVGKAIATAGLIVSYLGLAHSALGVVFLADMIKADRERVHNLEIKRQEITSDDGKLKVTTSGLWVKRTDLNQNAAFQASRKDKEMYVIVIPEAKSTGGTMTLAQHHLLTRAHMLQKMNNSSTTIPLALNIDGHPALQDEVSGTQNGTTLTFLHTTIDDGETFHQILAWTLKSRWAANQSELAEVTNSFHSEK
jgi:hypothetical protein